MKKELKEFDLSSRILLILGIIDIVRGFLHTFLVNWASQTFAKLDLNFVKDDQLTLLGAFGISNFLTGLIYILVSMKAKHLSPYVLIIIPISYLIGYIGLRVSGIQANASFYGKYFMLVYLLTCVITSGIYFIKKSRS